MRRRSPSVRHEPHGPHWLSLAAAAAVAALAALVLTAAPAAACCTAVVCPYCVSSSDNCVCGTPPSCSWDKPCAVCNVFGCNCNVPCGMWSLTSGNQCVYYPKCDSAEAKTLAKARFDEIDTNHDGKISPEEMAAWLHKQKPSWLKHINPKSLPANLKATKANEKALMKWEFDLADANHDGYIDPAEFDQSLGPGK
jgi:hypothetical protein